jgi:hypothetical protein
MVLYIKVLFGHARRSYCRILRRSTLSFCLLFNFNLTLHESPKALFKFICVANVYEKYKVVYKHKLIPQMLGGASRSRKEDEMMAFQGIQTVKLIRYRLVSSGWWHGSSTLLP